MKKVNKTLAALLLFAAPMVSWAAGGGPCGQVPCQEPDIDLGDQESLQRGAKLFVDYCLSCHAAAYQRYNRTARDIGLDEDTLEAEYMHITDKPGDLMKVAMEKEDAERWFGTKTPDLSLVARSRGPEWLYTYLLSFYEDSSRPLGVNNAVFKDVGMPHVMWELQGLNKAVYDTHTDDAGNEIRTITGFEPVRAGSMSEEEFETAMSDLTNFMVYLGEPAKMTRYFVGTLVIIFLVVFTALAYLLKKEYWKDVH